EAVLRLDSTHIQAQALLDQVRASIRKRERAEALLSQAKRELQTKQLTDAYRSILECLQHAPENKEAAGLLDTIKAAIHERERQRRLTEVLNRAEELIQSDEPEEAEAFLLDLDLTYPAAPKLKELLTQAAAAIQEKQRQRHLLETLASARSLVSGKKWT